MTSTAAELDAAHTELQAAIADQQRLQADYDALLGPFIAKRQDLLKARIRTKAADVNVERLSAAFEPDAVPPLPADPTDPGEPAEPNPEAPSE